MKINNLILYIAAGVAILLLAFSLWDTRGTTSYVDEIMKLRRKNIEYLKSDPGSPFQTDKIPFKEPNYFPVDPRFRITASFTPASERKLVSLRTSDGKDQQYATYGIAKFDFDGFHNELTILEVIAMGPGRNKLFLAFGDQTSAVETYGAGRYLEVDRTPGSSTIELDFNKAYNPYCAYNDKFSCPLPPPENLLRIAVRAGEKNYHP